MRMVTRASALLVMLLAVLLALTVGRSGVAAQDMTAAPLEFRELDGAQAAVSRTYTADFSGLIGTPSSTGEVPELTGVVSLVAVIGQFDSSDNAEAALERIDEESQAGLEEVEGAPELQEAEVDLGDASRAYTGAQEIEGQTLNLSMIMVQQDEFVYFVVTGAFDDEAQPLATEFTQTLIDTEAGDGEPRVNADGTSTGGLWDKFPQADDELVTGLTALDEQVYPEVESTPAS